MLTILRTAFLTYVRLLLILQGLGLGFLAFAFWPVRVSGGVSLALLGVQLPVAGLGVATIVIAVRLGRGRRWAAIAAILIELLWALAAAAVGCETIRDWPPLDFGLLCQVTVAAALFLLAVGGLLSRPVRAYAGLARPYS